MDNPNRDLLARIGAHLAGAAQPPDDRTVREAAWNAGGIPYNPDAAFPRYAREHSLGNPETGEFDFTYAGEQFRGQGFSEAIIYCRVGDWGQIKTVSW
jgi:hypothetical protein